MVQPAGGVWGNYLARGALKRLPSPANFSYCSKSAASRLCIKCRRENLARLPLLHRTGFMRTRWAAKTCCSPLGVVWIDRPGCAQHHAA